VGPGAVGAYTIFTGFPVRVDEVAEEETRSRCAQDGEACEKRTHDEHLGLDAGGGGFEVASMQREEAYMFN